MRYLEVISLITSYESRKSGNFRINRNFAANFAAEKNGENVRDLIVIKYTFMASFSVQYSPKVNYSGPEN